MSYHSSALPIDVATISRVMLFSAAFVASDNSAGAETLMAFPLQGSQRPRQFAEIPEQAGHDAERFFRDRQQNVFVGRVLRAAGIGVRHPHRRQLENIGKDIVGQRTAEVWQYRRGLSRRLADR